jgi:hypothetical protein
MKHTFLLLVSVLLEWAFGNADHRQPTLILFTTFDDKTDSVVRDLNTRFFLAQGLLHHSSYHYLFIINGCHRFEFSEQLLKLPNFEVLERPNECFDAGAWWQGVSYMHAKGHKFKQYIFLNSSVRGPFRPAYAGREWDWVRAFTAQLNDRVRLVGTRYAC